MPSGKARYNAPQSFADIVRSGQEAPISDFSDKLQQEIETFYPGKDTKAETHEENSAEIFSRRILAEAHWAIAELEEVRLSLTKQDLKAEWEDLRAILERARDRLRSLSPDFDLLLGIDANPFGLADSLDAMIKRVDEAGRLIDERPQKPRATGQRHEIAMEMAIRVLRVAKEHGMRVSASGSSHYPEQTSKAVLLLKAIGDDIGLRLGKLTWRNIVAEAKRAAGDL